MIIYTNLDDYNDNYLYFGDNIKNTIIQNGKFNRLIYSDESVVLNGIYMYIPFNGLKKTNNNTYLINKNDECIKKICDIEMSILNKFSSFKNKQFKLSEQLFKHNIKIFNYKNHLNIVILKISGLWEDEYNYGLTYKFINY